MPEIQERSDEKSSFNQDRMLDRRGFLKLGGAGLLSGMLLLFGVVGCGGSPGGDNGNDNGNGNNNNDHDNNDHNDRDHNRGNGNDKNDNSNND